MEQWKQEAASGPMRQVGLRMPAEWHAWLRMSALRMGVSMNARFLLMVADEMSREDLR